MKRITALILVLILLFPAALADTMVVVNCDEWVSLREAPSKSAPRLMKVPLYETVEDCEDAENGFLRCTYQGTTGYILADYLEPVEGNEPDMWIETAGAVEVVFKREYVNGGERLTVTASDAAGQQLWTAEGVTNDVTELTQTDGFVAGTAAQPRVMLYSAAEGLSCIDPATGEALWMIGSSQTRLGASISHAVDDQGRIYICGYYGPDPVCIDMDGNVIWQADCGSDDIYWPYQITITNEGVVTEYEMMAEGTGRIVYDLGDGHIVRTEKE